MSTGRSPTARRVWIWLDAADPREAAALAALDHMQATMPVRVRAGLMRDAVCRAILDITAGGSVGVDQPARDEPVPTVVGSVETAKVEPTTVETVPVAVEPVPVAVAPVAPIAAVTDHTDNNKPASVEKPGGLMW